MKPSKDRQHIFNSSNIQNNSLFFRTFRCFIIFLLFFLKMIAVAETGVLLGGLAAAEGPLEVGSDLEVGCCQVRLEPGGGEVDLLIGGGVEGEDGGAEGAVEGEHRHVQAHGLVVDGEGPEGVTGRVQAQDQREPLHVHPGEPVIVMGLMMIDDNDGDDDERRK